MSCKKWTDLFHFYFVQVDFCVFSFFLVGAFFVIILVDLCIWAVGSNMSLLGTLVEGCTFLPVVIVSIITALCDLMIKRDSIHWWIRCPWISVLILVNYIVCLNHLPRVVSSP